VTANDSGCGSCASKSTCGSFSFFKFGKKPDTHLQILNTHNLKVGDSVILSMGADKLLLGSVLVYLLPLFALFISAAIGKVLGGELVSIGLGIMGLFAGLLLVKKILGTANLAKQFRPKILRKVITIDT